ncbi:MAG: HAD family hydrolase [Pseudoclavibacter sp.]|nr:HAD family hydrolase [Pseudoclavibacter sp.]
MSADGRRLVALDIDGTILGHDGLIPQATLEQVTRLREAGHEVMLATGRSRADALPVHERLGLDSRFVVCANGASVLEREAGAPDGYATARVRTFDPSEVLRQLREGLRGARFAVETPAGEFLYSGRFPDASFEARGTEVSFETLLEQRVLRLVVIAPDQTVEEFMDRVDAIGLHRVSYSVGWTTWLDIAPEGVDKSVALEEVRAQLGIPRSMVVAAGDGRNDVEMLRWAGAEGASIAMWEAPPEVSRVAGEIAAPFHEDGLARALARFAAPPETEGTGHVGRGESEGSPARIPPSAYSGRRAVE